MRLQRLHLVNFRQFFEDQVVEFSTDDTANITVIHGENGSGKTALLNAFKWSFYGDTDTDTPIEKLVSERAIVEASVGATISMEVAIEFEHNGEQHTATRRARFSVLPQGACSSIGRPVFSLDIRRADGSFFVSPNPDVHIEQILPGRMHPYFFFNGERIEKLSSVSGADDIRVAVKALMGLEILERAQGHLERDVLKRLRRDLRGNATTQLQQAIDEENKLKEELDKTQQFIRETEHDRAKLEDERGGIDQQLERVGPIAALQAERLALETELRGIANELAQLISERSSLISRSGFLAFSTTLAENTIGILDDRRRKGELPSQIKQQFLDDLLTQKRCICGAPLEPGSPSCRAIEQFRASAVSNDVESAFIRLSGSAQAMLTAIHRFPAQLAEFVEREHTLRTRQEHKRGRLDVLSGQIGRTTVENVEQLEGRRAEIRADISARDRQLGIALERLEQYRKDTLETVAKRKDLERREKTQSDASRKLEMGEEVLRVLAALADSLSERVRVDLSEIVNDAFRTILKKDYWAEIASDYTLRIRKRIGGYEQEVVNKSTGEAQVSSLAFIGGLIALAKKRHGQQSTFYRGGVFPIVMDSPYGNLDPEYREKVAEAIPTLAEQVVILVSNSQWRGEVERAVSGRVGRSYTLMYHTRSRREGTVTTSVIEGAQHEFTEIREGYYE